MAQTSFPNRLFRSRVWRSFFRHGWPDNPLDRSLTMTSRRTAVCLRIFPSKHLFWAGPLPARFRIDDVGGDNK